MEIPGHPIDALIGGDKRRELLSALAVLGVRPVKVTSARVYVSCADTDVARAFNFGWHAGRRNGKRER